MVTNAAYLLFYRRRSERPLGGDYLASVAEIATKSGADSDSSQNSSRTNSPSGEGRRLDGFSRNGSSSALTGVGAAHQAGNGGLRGGIRRRDDDELPEYSEGMDIEDEENDIVPLGSGPLPYASYNDWSFSRISGSHGQSNRITAPPGSDAGGENDDDDASVRADGGGDISDADSRLAALGDSSGDISQMFDDDPPVQNVEQPTEMNEYDDMPIVELSAPNEEQQ